MTLISNESILNNIKENILIIDSNFNIINANNRLLTSLDLDEQDVVGKPCYEVTHCDPPDETCPLSEVLKTGKSSTKRRTCNDKSGSKVHVEVAVYPFTGEKDTDKFIHIERDVTERVRVEREIREHIAKLNEKVEGATLELQKKTTA